MKTHEYAAYAYGVVRSATAPETMVADADAYMNWCSQFFPGSTDAASAPGSPAEYAGAEGVPTKAPSPPYASVYPRTHQTHAPMHVSSRFFRRMFRVFFTRTAPTSSIPRPACIRKMKSAP